MNVAAIGVITRVEILATAKTSSHTLLLPIDINALTRGVITLASDFATPLACDTKFPAIAKKVTASIGRNAPIIRASL
jgi:hypothetical protein